MVAAWVFVSHNERSAPEEDKPKSQLAGNDYFFGEEGPSEK
jgi:hypothetical protein